MRKNCETVDMKRFLFSKASEIFSALELCIFIIYDLFICLHLQQDSPGQNF